MEKETKAWILTKCTDYTTDSRLQLGQVLTDPCRPSSALLPNGALKITQNYNISESEVDGNVSFRFWRDTISFPSATTDIVSRTEQSQLVREPKKLECYTMNFELDYLIKVCENEHILAHVQSHSLEAGPFCPALYIITGVQVAVDARLTCKGGTTIIRARGDNSNNGVRIQNSLQRTMELGREYSKTTSFVFAYKCNKINYLPQIGRGKAPESTSPTTKQPVKSIAILKRRPVEKAEFGAQPQEGEEEQFWVDSDAKHTFKFLSERGVV